MTGDQAKRVADEAAIAGEQRDRSTEVLRRYVRAGSLFQQNVAARVGL